MVHRATTLAVSLLLVCCAPATNAVRTVQTVSERPIGARVDIEAPLGLPALVIPADNPITPETIALGRRLFHDRRVSVNDSISCASCHDPRLGFADGRKTSQGIGGKTGMRNAPTVLNAAYAPMQFWDGRASSLEEQSAGPISNPLEMNQGHDVFVAKLQADSTYRGDFQKAFGSGRVTLGKVQKALASFERTLLSGNSPYDRFQFGGDAGALSGAARRGLEIFKDPKRGNCAACHSIAERHALFLDGKFHNLGVGIDSEGELKDLGRFDVTKVEMDKGAFKTPTLRNVAQTAPYMHDGSLKTLKQVVDFYAGGGSSNEYLDSLIRPLSLTGRERTDLVAFLESLTGEMPLDARLLSSK